MWTSPVYRAGSVGVDVASQACSKLEGSGVEFGPKTGLSHFWVRGGVICQVWGRQAWH